MPTEDTHRRQTRSQILDSQKQPSRPQIPSVTYIDPPHQHDSSKIKQPKHLPTRKSNWNKKQKIKYLVFLNYYSQLPFWGSDLKSIPTYKSLHQFVKSRSPQQCKSFHLSTRRNYKSIPQEIKALQQQLELQQGYQKMLDRYELDIVGFEADHGLLKKYELNQKDHFRKNFQQNCKDTGCKKKQNIPSGQSPPENEPDYNSKISFKDLIKDKQPNEYKKQERPQSNQEFLPLANMHDYVMPQENFLKGSINPGQNMPNMIIPNPQQPPISMYRQEGAFDGNESGKVMDKMHMENLRMQGSNPQGPSYGVRNLPNERMVPEGMGRMMEPNRGMYGQYPNYPSYGNSPFPDMNEMHLASFRNQMPYSIPPPGGIPFMMQGYNPYSMANLSSRYRQKIDDQGKDRRRSQSKMGRSLSPQKRRTHKPQMNEKRDYTENQRQILIQTHQHYTNWVRASRELEKRREMRRRSTNLVNL